MRPPRQRAGIDALVKRAQIIASYKVNGNVSKTAKETNSTRVTVRKWLKRHTADPTHGLLDGPRSGRPSKKAVLLANPDALELLRQAVRSKLKIPAMLKLLLEKTGISIGKVCLFEFLNTHLAASRKHRRRFPLTPSHKHKRMIFSREWVSRSWDDIVVTDSSNFYWPPECGSNNSDWVLYEDMDGDRPCKSGERWKIKIHAYAGVSKWGRTRLIVAPGTSIHVPGMVKGKAVNGENYIEILKEHLIPECRRIMLLRPRRSQRRRWIFQQDNAPAHKDKRSMEWIRNQSGFEVMDWPARSPDLSWIENLWAYVKKRLSQRTDLTKDNFLDAVNHEWDNMDEHQYQQTFGSIQQRLKDCINREGAWTKY